MNMADAVRILEQERLRGYNWFGEHKVRPGEVLIDYDGARWVVCAVSLTRRRKPWPALSDW